MDLSANSLSAAPPSAALPHYLSLSGQVHLKVESMGSLSLWHVLIVGVIAVLLFGGGGKISELMGDVAKGVKSFRRGLSEPETENLHPPALLPDKE